LFLARIERIINLLRVGSAHAADEIRIGRIVLVMQLRGEA